MSTAPTAPEAGLRRISKTAWAVLAAVAAVAGGVVSLLFTLAPGLKPDPREEIGAAVSIFAVEPKVRIDEWARRAYPADWRNELERVFGTPKPQPDYLAIEGDAIYVRTQVDGYKHRAVTLQWSVYDQRGIRLKYDRIAQPVRIPPLQIDAPNRRSVQLIFVPGIGDLVSPRETFVRIELLDPHGTLAVADTPLLRNGIPMHRPRPGSAAS